MHYGVAHIGMNALFQIVFGAVRWQQLRVPPLHSHLALRCFNFPGNF